MAPLVWFVTGCSSGLGEQFVHEALSRGDKVIATARNGASRLQHLADLGAHTADLDVTVSQDELTAKVNEAASKYGRIDVLINNAGLMGAGATEESPDEHFMSLFNVNFFGVLKTTRAVLPHMRKQRSGFIAFLGSPLGWKGIPGAAPYVASKFALEGIAECIRGEVASFGIQATIFDLGNFMTPILNDGRLSYGPRGISDYDETMERFKGIINYLDGKQPGDPKKAVKVMADVIKSEGVAAGKTAPERLALGTDMLGYIKNKCEETMATCQEWDAVVNSTDFDGLAAPQQSQADVVSSKLAE